MLVPVLAATAVVVGSAWLLLLALVGRSTFPARERVPLHSWQWSDVHRNARRGVACVAQVEVARAEESGGRRP